MSSSDEKTRVGWLTRNLASAANGTSAMISALGVHIYAGAEERDDCAVLGIDHPVDLVVGTDYVRGPKFMLFENGYLGLRDIARFCVTANVSDVAAMGATPIGFLAVVRYDKTMSDEDFSEVMLGIDEACSYYQMALLGGDTGSAERLILSGTALGACERGASLTRGKARPGDVVAVCGRVGGAGAAVLAASRGVLDSLNEDVREALLDCWRLPVAQPAVGQVLARSGRRIACQDISDGLRSTVSELAESSGVSIDLDLKAVPMAVGVQEVADLLEVDALALSVSASTDFQLCFTCEEEQYVHVSQLLNEIGEEAWIVGRCSAGSGVWVNAAGGERVQAPGVGWSHQNGDIGDVILRGLKGP